MVNDWRDMGQWLNQASHVPNDISQHQPPEQLVGGGSCRLPQRSLEQNSYEGEYESNRAAADGR